MDGDGDDDDDDDDDNASEWETASENSDDGGLHDYRKI